MIPDNNVYWANMGPTWVLSAPDGPHVGPMNLAISGYTLPTTIVTAMAPCSHHLAKRITGLQSTKTIHTLLRIVGCSWLCLIGCGIDNRYISTLRPRQNGNRFADDIFKCISLKTIIWTKGGLVYLFIHRYFYHDVIYMFMYIYIYIYIWLGESIRHWLK